MKQGVRLVLPLDNFKF